MTQHNQNDKKMKTFRMIKNRILISLSACLILAVILYILFVFVFFKIENIQVVSASGDAKASSFYENSEIIDISDVEQGEGLFHLSADEICKEIKEELPYIGNVTIKRVLPSTLKIIVEDTSAAFGVNINGKFMALDKDYKVLSMEDYLPQGAAKLSGVEFSDLEYGKRAVFADNNDESRLSTLVTACQEGGITNVTKYDIENIASVKIIVNSRITIIFGTLTELSDKIYLAVRTMEKELEDNPNAHIIINVTDSDRSYVRNDNGELEEDTVNYEEYSKEQEELTKDTLVTIG